MNSRVLECTLASLSASGQLTRWTLSTPVLAAMTTHPVDLDYAGVGGLHATLSASGQLTRWTSSTPVLWTTHPVHLEYAGVGVHNSPCGPRVLEWTTHPVDLEYAGVGSGQLTLWTLSTPVLEWTTHPVELEYPDVGVDNSPGGP